MPSTHVQVPSGGVELLAASEAIRVNRHQLKPFRCGGGRSEVGAFRDGHPSGAPSSRSVKCGPDEESDDSVRKV